MQKMCTWFLVLLYSVVLLAHSVQAATCSPDSSSCSFEHWRQSDCALWCNAEDDCPRGYPVGDKSMCGGFWNFECTCWVVGCSFPCFACNIGYREQSNVCRPCSAGKSSNIAATSCFNCAPGKASSGGEACSRCQPGEYYPDYNGVSCISCGLCSGAGDCSGGVHWYSTSQGADHCDRCSDDRIANEDHTGCESCVQGKYVLSHLSQCQWCAPGKTTNGAVGYANCAECSAGKASERGTHSDVDPLHTTQICAACEGGKYSDNGAFVCIDCPPGEFSVERESGNAYCTPCSPGRYGNADGSPYTGSTLCLACPNGKYSTTGYFQCLPCDPGSTSFQTPNAHTGGMDGASSCVPCEAGKFNGGSDGICESCPAGKFSLDGALYCELCEFGHWSTDEASFCTACPAGKYLEDNECVACAVNTYNNEEAQVVCNLCGLGKYSASTNADCTALDTATCTGATHCLDCPADTKRGLTDATDDSSLATDDSCVPCPDDRHAGTGSQICVMCPLGKYKPEGSTVCVDCEAGKQQRDNGCVECELGRYEPDPGSFSCSFCDPGKSTLGVIQVDGLPTSPFGNTVCYLCATGNYSTLPGDACEMCPSGKKAADVGEPDTTVITEGANICRECSPGHKSDEGSHECTPCPVGKYSYPFDSSHSCDSCSPGKFTNETGKSSCESCYPGFWTNKTGAVACDSCSPGKMTGQFSRGSTECVECSAGKYSNDDDPDSYRGCDSCNDLGTAGQHQTENGATTCIDCPAGTESGLWPNAVECTECEPGKFTASAADQDCDNCPVGRFSNMTGASECLYCPDGKFSNWLGRPTCQTCNAGKYSNQDANCGSDDLKMTCCRECDAGKTSSAGGPCVQCPQGKYSLEGASYCYTLPTGEDMFQCPPSEEVMNVCKWFYVDDWTNSLGLPNENDPSPFGVSCANYTICSFDVVESEATDEVINLDTYVVMCEDCATDLGFMGIGTIEGTIGNCAGKQFQKFCYEGNTLDTCPSGMQCEYQYGGDEETRGMGTLDPDNVASPFTRTHEDDEEIPEGVSYSICESYSVCEVETELGYPKLTVACEACKDGYLGRSFLSTTIGSCTKGAGKFPTACFNLGTDFNTCPTVPLNLQRRLNAEREREERRLLGCSLCSCRASTCEFPCVSCEASEHCTCEHDDTDCDESICHREEEGGDTDDVTSLLVDCFYLYGDREDSDASERTPSWSHVDGGDRSPFYDSCQDYVLCDLVTSSGSRDDYWLGCSECAANHYPALDPTFDQTTKPECPGSMSDYGTLLPTFCYNLNIDALANLDFDEYCPDNNPHQINVCNYWKKNDVEGVEAGWSKISREYGGSSEGNPYGQGCERTSFCAFDIGDMIYDHYYVQCIQCRENWIPIYEDKLEAATSAPENYDPNIHGPLSGDVCEDSAYVPSGKIIVDCVPGPTSQPSLVPSSRPSIAPPETHQPSCDGCIIYEDETQPTIFEDKAMMGLIFFLTVSTVLCCYYRRQRKKRFEYDDDYSERSSSMTSTSGVEMQQNPLSRQYTRKGNRRRHSTESESESEGESESESDSDSQSDYSSSWLAKQDPKTGKKFWFNRSTKEVSWDDPHRPQPKKGPRKLIVVEKPGPIHNSANKEFVEDQEDVDEQQPVSKRGPNAPPPPPEHLKKLAKDKGSKRWNVFTDKKSGNKYYVNRMTKQTSWTKPKNGLYCDEV